MDTMDTLCIKDCQHDISDESTNLWLCGVVPPIYYSNGEKPTLNPTRQSLEQTLTVLDGAQQPTLTYASGMAALSAACLTLLKKDDHVIIVDDAYSGTTNLFKKYLIHWSIDSSFVDLSSSAANITRHFRSNTRLVWLETPTNPSLRLVDINSISSIVHSHDPSIIVLVDNTFASPLNQSPLSMGADICFASMTKYINGHSDVIGGCLSMNRKDLYDKFLATQRLFGMQLSPLDCFLVHRGLNTLAVRVRQHVKNAYEIAQFLERHPVIEKVFYPKLPSHPQHEIYLKQGGASGMCSYVLKKGANVKKFLGGLKLCNVAVSLGGCETLIESPALMTHRSTMDTSASHDIMSQNLIRMSVGLENVRDIIADLDRALNQSIEGNNQTEKTFNPDFDLIEEAIRVFRRSNIRKTKGTVAALRTTSGNVYSGIHFETLSSSATIAADIMALSLMINDNHQDIQTMVILNEVKDDQNHFEISKPSDECKQLIEDLNPNAEILQGTIDKPHRVEITKL